MNGGIVSKFCAQSNSWGSYIPQNCDAPLFLRTLSNKIVNATVGPILGDDTTLKDGGRKEGAVNGAITWNPINFVFLLFMS